MRFITAIVFISSLFSQSDHCHSQPNLSSRSIYDIGDTLSIEDQNLLFPVCSGADGYNEGDSFSFSDLNGNLNGGDHKLTIISMNATW